MSVSFFYILFLVFVFFFNDTATTEIYTLSLHDALPILIKIWNTWIRNPSLWITKYRGGDQVFIQNVVAADMFFQTYTSLVGSFKPVSSKRPLKSKPEKKAIICLHGNPRIHEVVETYGWVQEVLKEVV